MSVAFETMSVDEMQTYRSGIEQALQARKETLCTQREAIDSELAKIDVVLPSSIPATMMPTVPSQGSAEYTQDQVVLDVLQTVPHGMQKKHLDSLVIKDPRFVSRSANKSTIIGLCLQHLRNDNRITHDRRTKVWRVR